LLLTALPGWSIQCTHRAVRLQMHAGHHLDPEINAFGFAIYGRWCLPEASFAVEAPREDPSAVRAKDSGRDPSLVHQGRAEGFPGNRIPQPGSLVAASGQDSLAVGAEHCGPDILLMKERLVDGLPQSRLPEPGGPIPAPRQDSLAV